MTENRIAELIAYAENKGLIEAADRIWAANRLLDGPAPRKGWEGYYEA